MILSDQLGRGDCPSMRVLIVDDEPNIRRTLVGLGLGDGSGPALLEPLLAQLPRLAMVVITAHASIDTALDAMRRGAFDYLPKPFTPAQVRAVLERVANVRGLRDRVADLED